MKQKQRRVDRADRVEIGFLESIAARCPRDAEVMKALGDLYTRVGRVSDGLAIDLELVRLCACDPVVWYNLGCSHALSGEKDAAFGALTKAIELGYADVECLRKDGDLANLRDDARFEELCVRLSGAA